MNHPDISTYNGNLYLVNMIKDAEDFRQAKNLEQPKENIFRILVKKIPTLSTKSLKNSATPTA